MYYKSPGIGIQSKAGGMKRTAGVILLVVVRGFANVPQDLFVFGNLAHNLWGGYHKRTGFAKERRGHV